MRHFAAIVMVLIAFSYTNQINSPTEFESTVRTYPEVRVLSSYSEKDVECLARNIYHESRGEPVDGQLAVAQVTINRWHKNPKRSLCTVVYSQNEYGCQFSWVCEDTKLPKRSSQVWQQSVVLARTALTLSANGLYCCKGLENALYFHSVTVHPRWSKTRTLIGRIGNHVFYS
jgi:spore germination cell wall hydrolase CwlJ-like protein